MQSARHLFQVLLAATIVALGLGNPAHAGITSERKLAAIIKHTPAPTLVAEGRQMKEAEKFAAQLPKADTFWGVGRSMEPLYATNTAVVVEPIAYDDIKKGMTVVYVKSNGTRVAHPVVDEDRKGYIVQGVNNDEPDVESVNERNIVGVITHAFASADTNFRSELTKRLAGKGKVTLIASAR